MDWSNLIFHSFSFIWNRERERNVISNRQTPLAEQSSDSRGGHNLVAAAFRQSCVPHQELKIKEVNVKRTLLKLVRTFKLKKLCDVNRFFISFHFISFYFFFISLFFFFYFSSYFFSFSFYFFLLFFSTFL